MSFFDKRMSIAHPENSMGFKPNEFYYLLKNSSQEYKNEIHDIYFGKFFYYEYNGVKKKYGNPMGVEASDAHVENLFKIQEEYGIEISLTVNSLNVPIEFQTDPNIKTQFVEWIGSYYDRGLRSCTIGWTHLMREGLLQKRCPEMRWKNTVNHLTSDVQQVVDMVYLGYDTIILDRSLNRNLPELRRIRKAVDKLNSKLKRKHKILLSLLVKEGCVYRCPFKSEHDSAGETISANYFSTVGASTCSKWRAADHSILPRMGVDLTLNSKENFDAYLECIDILKYSGRFVHIKPFVGDIIKYNGKLSWNLTSNRKKYDNGVLYNNNWIFADSFKEVYDNTSGLLSQWNSSYSIGADETNKLSKLDYHQFISSCNDSVWNLWLSEEGKSLENTLTRCKSQCFGCNKCERTFGLEQIDSVLEL